MNSNHNMILVLLVALMSKYGGWPRRSCADRSYTSKGQGWRGLGSFCKENLCFSTAPCRPTPFTCALLNWVTQDWLGRALTLPYLRAWIRIRHPEAGLGGEICNPCTGVYIAHHMSWWRVTHTRHYMSDPLVRCHAMRYAIENTTHTRIHVDAHTSR